MKFIYKITATLIMLNILLFWGFTKGDLLFTKAIKSSPKIQTFDQTKRLSFKYSSLVSDLQNSEKSYYLNQSEKTEEDYNQKYDKLMQFAQDLSLDYGPVVTIDSQVESINQMKLHFSEIVNLKNKEFSLISNISHSSQSLINFIERYKLKKSYMVVFYKLKNFEKEYLLNNNPEVSDLFNTTIEETVKKLTKGRYSKKEILISLFQNYNQNFDSLLMNRIELRKNMNKSPILYQQLRLFNFNTLLLKSDLAGTENTNISESLIFFKKLYNVIGIALLFLIFCISCVSLYVLHGHSKASKLSPKKSVKPSLKENLVPNNGSFKINSTEDIKVEIHPVTPIESEADSSPLTVAKEATPEKEDFFGPPMPVEMSISKMNENLFDINDQISSLRETSKKVQMLVDDNTEPGDKLN